MEGLHTPLTVWGLVLPREEAYSIPEQLFPVTETSERGEGGQEERADCVCIHFASQQLGELWPTDALNTTEWLRVQTQL